jgi:hypothetical protein
MTLVWILVVMVLSGLMLAFYGPRGGGGGGSRG